MAFYTDLLAFLYTLVLIVYDHAPWLVWAAVMCVGTCVFLYACALANAAWRLCTSADERAWFRFLRQARRERYLEDARQRGELHPLWTRGDGGYILGLLALAGIVILLCR